jgi:hypothetical protein
MRYLCLALLFAITSGSNQPAQNQTTASVEVVRFNWSKERINWERDPFGGPLENFDEVRARTRNEKRIADAKRGGGAAEVDRLKRDARADSAIVASQHRSPQARYVFMYKATIRNLSDKTIKSIDWDYVFTDKQTSDILERHEFTSEEKINPGKTKELVVTISKPPTATISLTALNSSEREGLAGQVILVRVDYVDGTSWQRP